MVRECLLIFFRESSVFPSHSKAIFDFLCTLIWIMDMIWFLASPIILEEYLSLAREENWLRWSLELHNLLPVKEHFSNGLLCVNVCHEKHHGLNKHQKVSLNNQYPLIQLQQYLWQDDADIKFPLNSTPLVDKTSNFYRNAEGTLPQNPNLTLL